MARPARPGAHSRTIRGASGRSLRRSPSGLAAGRDALAEPRRYLRYPPFRAHGREAMESFDPRRSGSHGGRAGRSDGQAGPWTQAEGSSRYPLASRLRAPAPGLVAPVRLRLGEAESNAGGGPGSANPGPRLRLPPDEVEALLLRCVRRPRAPPGEHASKTPASSPEPGRQSHLPLEASRRGLPAVPDAPEYEHFGSESPDSLVDPDPALSRGPLRDVPGEAPGALHPGGILGAGGVRGVRKPLDERGPGNRRSYRPRTTDRSTARVGSRPRRRRARVA